MLRTHNCGELRKSDAGKEVILCGWVEFIRDLGQGKFILLRDRYGKTQVVVNPQSPAPVLEVADKIKYEYVVKVTGTVAERPEGQTNPKMPTGEIEITITDFEILNECKTPPFLPSAVEDLPGEDTRLKYRYLDLRRQAMQDTLILRGRITKAIRDYLEEHDFVDIETPILGRSTPEGARDYLVPSRVHPGEFYALPQSPQIYKQIMMIAGYDRYMQVARCFRDEDLRADRQPEFTQLDLEMSFVDEDDIMGMIDGLMKHLAKKILDLDIELPLPRMSYDEAMTRFGHDAPDLRFGMEIVDCTAWATGSDFGKFANAVSSGHFVRCINAKGAFPGYSRKKIGILETYVKEDFGAKGLAWFKCDENDGSMTSPIAKFFDDEKIAQLKEMTGAEPGDLLLFIADSWEVSCKALYGLRRKLGAELNMYDPKEMSFSWIVRFPMFDHDEESNCWHAMHHPFTAPLDEDLELLESDAGKCRAKAYDLVINGFEAGGGTIRIHDSEIQSKVFELLGMDAETARDRFGFLLDALKYGAPPHGGIALGIDRVVMLFAGLDNIRDCVAFPKTKLATDLMTEAPSCVDLEQLDELALNIQKAEEK